LVILLLLPLLQHFLLLQITLLQQVLLLLLQIFLLRQVLLQLLSLLATLQLVKLLAGGRVPTVKPAFLTSLPSSVGSLV
jgi:hypothetical protein